MAERRPKTRPVAMAAMNHAHLVDAARRAGYEPWSKAEGKGFTAMGEKIGVTDGTVSRWFNKPDAKQKATAPDGPNLIKLALLFGVSPAYLIGEGEALADVLGVAVDVIATQLGEEAAGLVKTLAGAPLDVRGWAASEVEKAVAKRLADRRQRPTAAAKAAANQVAANALRKAPEQSETGPESEPLEPAGK